MLAALFVVAVACQVQFSRDAVRDLANKYPQVPFGLEAPWPTVTWSDPALHRGDRVVTVDGQKPAGVADVLVAVRRKAPGDMLRVEVLRDGAAVRVAIRLIPTRPSTSGFVYVFAAVVWFALPALSLALGFWVAAIRPGDSRAWMLLGLMLGLIQFLLDAGGRIDPYVFGWPAFLRVPALIYSDLALATWPIWMMLFGVYFPDRWKLDRRAPWAKWILIVPLAAQTLLRTAWAIGKAEHFDSAAFLIPWSVEANKIAPILWIVAMSLFFIPLKAKVRDPETEPDSRRRLALLHGGATVSFVPLTLVCTWALIDHRWPPSAGVLLMFALIWLFGFPLTMAYVIVVQRALDVKVVVRMGVQYALAQGSLRTLQVLCSVTAGVLALLLALDPNTDRTQKILLIAAAVAVVFVARMFSGTARSWVDRRFFREAYQADRILSELSEDVRSVTETGRLFEMVSRRIAASLHVEQVAALIRANGSYVPAFALGYGGEPAARFSASGATAQELLRQPHRSTCTWRIRTRG